MKRRFVDQDVRDNLAYFDIAKAYVNQYTGEFSYLHEMKARIGRNQDLTVAMVRGVLNCMMGDPRVEIDLTMEQTVSNLSNAYAKLIHATRPTTTGPNVECPLMAAGIYHSHRAQYSKYGYMWCPGKYRINRQPFRSRVTSTKMRYLVAPGGGVIHKVGKLDCVWYPNEHEPGYKYDPDLMGTGKCGTQWFREPRLIDTLSLVTDLRPGHQGEILRPCKRCFYNGGGVL